MATNTTTEQENTMHHLTSVLTVADSLELSAGIEESILAATEYHVRGADEHTTVKPYVAGEHTAPVQLREPLVVVKSIGVEELGDGSYLVHVTGAAYSEGYAGSHPLAELYRTRGRRDAHRLATVPAWEEVRVGDAHVIGRRSDSKGGHTMPSGVYASPIDITLQIAIGVEQVEREVKIPGPPEDTQTIARKQTAQRRPARQPFPGRKPYRPITDIPES